MINDSQPPGFDVSSYTIEEINSITSEYTLKNTVSLSGNFFEWMNIQKYSRCMTFTDKLLIIIIASSQIHLLLSFLPLCPQDIFAVAVSLITGKIVYISDQAASILNCKREVFNNAKFVEFLTPQDVGVFYSFTTPYRLPSWSMCTGAGMR